MRAIHGWLVRFEFSVDDFGRHNNERLLIDCRWRRAAGSGVGLPVLRHVGLSSAPRPGGAPEGAEGEDSHPL